MQCQQVPGFLMGNGYLVYCYINTKWNEQSGHGQSGTWAKWVVRWDVRNIKALACAWCKSLRVLHFFLCNADRATGPASMTNTFECVWATCFLIGEFLQFGQVDQGNLMINVTFVWNKMLSVTVLITNAIHT